MASGCVVAQLLKDLRVHSSLRYFSHEPWTFWTRKQPAHSASELETLVALI